MIPKMLRAFLFLAFLSSSLAHGQREVAGAAALKQSLDRLRIVGSVLMIAAHPDDENTAFLAWCSKGKKVRTAYLSLTRGEGGQNLIGSEQGDRLGVIRTQELLAARQIDGAEQYFTRSIDFGFSKTAQETLQKWGKEQVLADVVWVIRSFRPDVIVLRFSGTPRDGHGHHQSSALLGKEAFRAAADPTRFPEQLQYVKPWQARRLLWNGFSFNRQQEQEMEKLTNRIAVDLGKWDPVLGYSYSEIAGMSRSEHRSQAMGSPERKGSAMNYLIHVDGQPAVNDIFEEVDLTWRRIPGTSSVETALTEAQQAFRIDDPSVVLPALTRARAALASNEHPDARLKLAELDETIAAAAGVWVELNAKKPTVTAGETVGIECTLVARGTASAKLQSIRLRGASNLPGFPLSDEVLIPNKPLTKEITWSVPEIQEPSQPFWLRNPHPPTHYVLDSQQDVGKPEGEPLVTGEVVLEVNGSRIELRRPVIHRYVDRVRGELRRPFIVVPPVSLRVSETALLFPNSETRPVEVEIRAERDKAEGEVKITLPTGWSVLPASIPFRLDEAGQQVVASFQVKPPASAGRGTLQASATLMGHEVATGRVDITYEHIPPQTLLPPASAGIVRSDIRLAVRRIGYVMGAGDEVPDTLRQLGAEVTFLNHQDLARGDLSRFEAIVTGVRAWNVRPDLRASYHRLAAFAEAGGTVLVQYNVTDSPFQSGDSATLRNIAPWPVKVGRDRVTVEEAPVTLLQPEHPVFRFPNMITPADFEGWVQERGLYFPAEWDPRFEALTETGDPGEKRLQGGLLYAKIGKGAWILTSYSWFRQLPAGVPGASRLFANLVSAAKAP